VRANQGKREKIIGEAALRGRGGIQLPIDPEGKLKPRIFKENGVA